MNLKTRGWPTYIHATTLESIKEFHPVKTVDSFKIQKDCHPGSTLSTLNFQNLIQHMLWTDLDVCGALQCPKYMLTSTFQSNKACDSLHLEIRTNCSKPTRHIQIITISAHLPRFWRQWCTVPTHVTMLSLQSSKLWLENSQFSDT